MTDLAGNGFAGDIEGLSLADLVQFARLAGDDRKLVVQSEENQGAIYFADSGIVHAEFGELIGEEAFYRIMCWPSGTFSMIFAKIQDRTIDSSWNFLLLEAALRIDNQEDIPAQKSGHLKVLVVDDSRLFTKAFTKLFEEKIDARVVGTANNGQEALKFLEAQVPDLVTLDINMPVMGGDVALKHIMIRSPAPVVLVSSFNDQTCAKLMDFMRFGSVDVVAKPVDQLSWELVSKRLHYILLNAKEFCVDNVSRAKILKVVEGKDKLAKSEKPAKRLYLILGGLGGLLELQKIIPVLEYNDETAVVVLQNMYPDIVKHLALYFDNFTSYVTTSLNLGSKLMGGQCRIGNCHGKREIIFDQGNPAIVGLDDNQNAMTLNADQLLVSAAEVFGAALSVVIISGVDLDLKKGLEFVTEKGGRIILQDPDSCLLPGPIKNIESFALQECCLKPEEIAPYLAAQP